MRFCQVRGLELSGLSVGSWLSGQEPFILSFLCCQCQKRPHSTAGGPSTAFPSWCTEQMWKGCFQHFVSITSVNYSHVHRHTPAIRVCSLKPLPVRILLSTDMDGEVVLTPGQSPVVLRKVTRPKYRRVAISEGPSTQGMFSSEAGHWLKTLYGVWRRCTLE